MKYFWDKIKLLLTAFIIVFVFSGVYSLIQNYRAEKEFRRLDKYCVDNYSREICDLLPYASEEQLQELLQQGLLPY